MANQQERTATQRRNARKRRSKQQQQQHKQGHQDPSLLYIADPLAAPIIAEARTFFRTVTARPFAVHNNHTAHSGWRTVAKLAVRSTASGDWNIGLFAPHSHTIVPLSATSSSHHPALNTAVRCLQQYIVAAQTKKQRNNRKRTSSRTITAYNEATGEGLVRYILLSVETSTERVQMTFVVNKGTETVVVGTVDNVLHSWIHALVKYSSTATSTTTPNWHSIWVHSNAQDRHCNSIIDTTTTTDTLWECIYHHAHDGQIPVCESPLSNNNVNVNVNVPLYFPPNVFRQANLTAFSHILQAIRKYLLQRDACRHVVELYGGVGTIGLHLLPDLIMDTTTITGQGGSLICSDANPYNQACFERSVQQLKKCYNSTSSTATIRYIPLSAVDMVHQHPDVLALANVMIVDPPRKGLEPSVATALATSCCKSSTTHTLVYVSCGFPAFQRDYEVLTKNGGGWELDHAEGHVLFPGSDAVETLAFFRRRTEENKKRKGSISDTQSGPSRKRTKKKRPKHP